MSSTAHSSRRPRNTSPPGAESPRPMVRAILTLDLRVRRHGRNGERRGQRETQPDGYGETRETCAWQSAHDERPVHERVDRAVVRVAPGLRGGQLAGLPRGDRPRVEAVPVVGGDGVI